ncbi:MAG: ATP-binding protein [Clostridia bacterium]|nr:ATP-binding protein [Clostridia bacterium]
MKKDIQLQVMMLLFVLGMVIIIGTGFFYINLLKNFENNVGYDITEEINILVAQTKILINVSTILFGIIVIIIATFLSKVVVMPITRLVESIKKISEGEDIDISKINNEVNNAQVKELLGAFEQITYQLQANLREVDSKKNQIQIILQHMTDGIIVFNKQGTISHINPAAKRLLEIEDEKNTFEEVFKKINLDINIEKIMYLENWTSFGQRINFNDVYLNILFEMFKNENGSPSGVMVVIKDITENVKLDNMRKEFVADVSHELKTPITSIMGYADTLLEGEYDKETIEFLTVISTEARRMAKLVTDLLELSKYDNNRKKMRNDEFNIIELVKKCQEKLKIEIKKKKHHIDIFAESELSNVVADKDAIERVILNILTNSIKYTMEKGDIKIYIGCIYNDVYVKITDNGIGIPEEDLKRIFERFYRVDKARTRQAGGTGLGLSIAKEILNQNNGTIDIKSEVGKGTEVVIKIPTKIIVE